MLQRNIRRTFWSTPMSWMTEMQDPATYRDRAAKSLAVPIGMANPLWLAFGAAASAGAAWWLMTRLARPANLEAALAAEAPRLDAPAEVDVAPPLALAIAEAQAALATQALVEAEAVIEAEAQATHEVLAEAQVAAETLAETQGHAMAAFEAWAAPAQAEIQAPPPPAAPDVEPLPAPPSFEAAPAAEAFHAQPAPAPWGDAGEHWAAPLAPAPAAEKFEDHG
jgi:hypothetical protein